MTDREKQQIVKESIAIFEAQCAALAIDPHELPTTHSQLAMRMFVEGVAWWQAQLKDVQENKDNNLDN